MQEKVIDAEEAKNTDPPKAQPTPTSQPPSDPALLIVATTASMASTTAYPAPVTTDSAPANPAPAADASANATPSVVSCPASVASTTTTAISTGAGRLPAIVPINDSGFVFASPQNIAAMHLQELDQYLLHLFDSLPDRGPCPADIRCPGTQRSSQYSTVGCRFCARSGQGIEIPLYSCNTHGHCGACGFCV